MRTLRTLLVRVSAHEFYERVQVFLWTVINLVDRGESRTVLLGEREQ